MKLHLFSSIRIRKEQLRSFQSSFCTNLPKNSPVPCLFEDDEFQRSVLCFFFWLPLSTWICTWRKVTNISSNGCRNKLELHPSKNTWPTLREIRAINATFTVLLRLYNFLCPSYFASNISKLRSKEVHHHPTSHFWVRWWEDLFMGWPEQRPGTQLFGYFHQHKLHRLNT